MKHMATLDGLRAASILAVLSAHLLPLGPKFLRLNEMAAGMGMSLFFGLSGYLITTNLLSGQLPKVFAIRRSARIVPLYVVYLLVAFVFIDFDLYALLVNLAFLENYLHSTLRPINGHLWSLCVEGQFYLAIGLVVAAFGRDSLRYVVPTACVLVTGIRIATGSYINIMTHLRVDEILAGGCIAVLFHRRERKATLSQWWLLVVILFWAIASNSFSGPVQYLRPYAAALVIAIALQIAHGLFRSTLTSSVSGYIAKISYALYIIHPLTAYGFMNEGTTLERYLLKRPISFALTLLLAHFSTFHWEAWWINWGKAKAAKLRPTEVS